MSKATLTLHLLEKQDLLVVFEIANLALRWFAIRQSLITERD